MGVTSPVLAPRIGAAQGVDDKILKWREGMDPRFISSNAAALHTFDFTFLDIWIRKKIRVIPSRKPEVSAGHWNEVYTPADDKSRLKGPRQETVVMLEVIRESRGGIYLIVDKVAPYGEEPVEIVINDQVFYQAGDLMLPARPDSGVDMRQCPSGQGPKPNDGRKEGDANKEHQGEDDPIESKGGKNEFDLGALE